MSMILCSFLGTIAIPCPSVSGVGLHFLLGDRLWHGINMSGRFVE
jgi:hypothetical protein